MPRGIPNRPVRDARDPRMPAEQLQARSPERPIEHNPFLEKDSEYLPIPEPMPGYALKWMRVTTFNERGERVGDGKNIAKHLTGKLKYEYVLPDEQPALSMLMVKRPDMNHGVIQVDDLVLVKVPQELHDLYFEAIEHHTRTQFAALHSEYSDRFNHRHSGLHMERTDVERGQGVVFDE